jgi:hypothetical protein
MLNFGLRFGPLFAGLFFLWLSTLSARWGEPPPVSLFFARDGLIVTEATTITQPVGNGTTRTVPILTVEWPRESGQQVEVAGLLPVQQRGNAARAREIVAAHPVGSEIAVRLVGGQPMANRQDLFSTLHALFMAVMGSLLTVVGLLLNRALR